ncbi:hypothetical protein KBZ94_39125 [Streptomyces sp. RM72]|uniref:hypothetical protein n=1 Tax=Streptomyces sp. RM72 TaxID=1115510 RepID=UPI001B385B9B|nr:hypothetical protein [Streptomyces sp. RM72]MBQ0890865.1 hypothetical protein [Streptomyces sp. RM72]
MTSELPDPHVFGPLVLTEGNLADEVRVEAENTAEDKPGPPTPDDEGSIAVEKTDAERLHRQQPLSSDLLRADRIVDEVLAAGGDARMICELFGLGIEAAARYTRPYTDAAAVQSGHPARGAVPDGAGGRHHQACCAVPLSRLGRSSWSGRRAAPGAGVGRRHGASVAGG